MLTLLSGLILKYQAYETFKLEYDGQPVYGREEQMLDGILFGMTIIVMVSMFITFMLVLKELPALRCLKVCVDSTAEGISSKCRKKVSGKYSASKSVSPEDDEVVVVTAELAYVEGEGTPAVVEEGPPAVVEEAEMEKEKVSEKEGNE